MDKKNINFAILYVLLIAIGGFNLWESFVEPKKAPVELTTDWEEHPVMMRDIQYLQKRVSALEIEVGVSVDYLDQ